MKRLCIVGMLLWLVAGCGQKGALYLPADTKQPQTQLQPQTERSNARTQPGAERGNGQSAAAKKRQKPRPAVQP